VLERETERRRPVSQMFIRSGLDHRTSWTQASIALSASA